MDTSVRLPQKLDRRDAWCAAALLPATVLFLLVCSFTTSPLTPNYYSNDPAFFTLMGRAFLNGKFPYVDFFDMKGPVIFFLEALGQAICLGRTGGFILQTVFDFCTALLLFLTARLFVSRFRSLIAVLLAFVFFASTKPENMTEEFSLTPVCLCLYLALRVCLRQEDGDKSDHPPVYAFIYGLCSGFILWLKVTHGVLIFAVVLYYTCSLLYNRKIKLLLYNALAFIGGLAAVTVPLLIWFAAHGALYDLMEGTFIVPIVYALNGVSGREDMAWIKFALRLSPILAVVVAIVMFRLHRQRLGRMLLCCCVMSIVGLVPGNGYSHYFTLEVPYITLGVALVFQFLRDRPAERPWLRPLVIMGAVLYCVCLVLVSGHFWRRALNSAIDPDLIRVNRVYAAQGAMIPPQEQDSVLVYAGAYAPCWYEVTGLLPCYKHCAYEYISLSDKLIEDYTQMLNTDPPRWFAVRANLHDYSVLDCTVKAVLEEKYEQASERGGGIILYHLRDDA